MDCGLVGRAGHDTTGMMVLCIRGDSGIAYGLWSSDGGWQHAELVWRLLGECAQRTFYS